jgi:hypothetical protein
MPTIHGNKNLILTVVQGADFDYVASFLRSLEQTGCTAQRVIFAAAMKGDAVDRMREYGATVVPYRHHSKRLRELAVWPLWPVWRRYFNTARLSAFQESLAQIALPLFYRRHLLYLQYLRDRQREFDRVFITDIRDVFFQADPFAWRQPEGLHVFLLDGVHTVKSSQLCRNWTENQFGRTDATPHLDKAVSCAGTTFGDAGAMVNYLSQMVETSLRARKLRKMVAGDDQAVHNYLIYEKLLPSATLYTNGSGPVMTTTVPMTMADLRFDREGRVLDDAGAVVPVLHQYDRVPGLKEHLIGRLPKQGHP